MNEYRWIVTNSHGESIDLWGDKEVALISIEGVSPEAEVNTSKLGSNDGSYYMGSYCPDRSISMIVQYRNEAIDAEKAKLRIYRIFRTKEKIILRCISPNQDMYIEGYVTNCDTPPTTFPMVSQISIKSPDPYFRKTFVEPIQLFGMSKLFYFTKEGITLNRVCFGNSGRAKVIHLDYGGDIATGVVIRVALEAACDGFRIDNYTAGAYISLTGEFLAGDVIEISTEDGRPYINMVRNGETVKALKYLDEGSEFWKLSPGNNDIKFTSGSLSVSAANVVMYYDVKVGGV